MGGTGVQNLEYTWDKLGNLATRKDLNQSSLTETFAYDNLYRLLSATLSTGPSESFTYNALGNLTSRTGVGSYTYHASKKHQVVSTGAPTNWSFGYDANGNMTSGRGASIDWTSYNYPACIRVGAACTGSSSDYASFSYTPDRQYWRQISNYASGGGTATTTYVGGLLERVATSSGTDYRHYIRAGGSTIIVSRQSSGTNSVYYVTSDHLGSSSAITNSSGGILINSSFGAFGARRGANWTGSPSGGDWSAIAGTTRRGFTEHSMLDNLNLMHMNGRVYDQMLGRFLSADSYITEPLNTQNYNRYSYVYNNPLRFSDPSGFATTGIRPSETNWGPDYTDPTALNWTDLMSPVVVSSTNFPSERERGDFGIPANPEGPSTPRNQDLFEWSGGKPKCPMGNGMSFSITDCAPAFDDLFDSMPGKELVYFAEETFNTGVDIVAAPIGRLGDLVLDAAVQSRMPTMYRTTLGTLAAAFDSNNAANTIKLGAGLLLRVPGATIVRGVGAASETAVVIGKLDDLKNLGPAERSLLSRLPNRGNPQANWQQNSRVLRQEMKRGLPIRDASVDSSGNLISNTGFLRAERNLLQSRGWTYNPSTTMWHPPVGP